MVIYFVYVGQELRGGGCTSDCPLLCTPLFPRMFIFGLLLQQNKEKLRDSLVLGLHVNIPTYAVNDDC